MPFLAFIAALSEGRYGEKGILLYIIYIGINAKIDLIIKFLKKYAKQFGCNEFLRTFASAIEGRTLLRGCKKVLKKVF